MKKLKPIPVFKSEDAERRFWDTHDSTEYIDWSRARRTIFPNLKTSTRTISVRLPSSMIDALKSLANRKDVPYQSLMKLFLADRITAEYKPVSDRPLIVRESPAKYGGRK